MINEIYPLKFVNHFKPGQIPEENDTLFHFEGNKVLCHIGEGSITFPRVGDSKTAENIIYLFEIDGNRFFLCLDDDFKAEGAFEYVEVRILQIEDESMKPLIFAAFTARHLNAWYRSNRYCGFCGQPLKHSDTERAMVCTCCGRPVYPRINPAVIVGVVNGDKFLLTKYANRNQTYYSLIAGFAEIGETFEDTVRREVMEETGLSVKNIHYYKSQPWGVSGDMLAGYICEVDGDPEIKMDKNELKEAFWMPREEVPGKCDDISLTNEMISSFHAGTLL